MYAQKRKHNALEKTPVSMLQELCVQEKDTFYDSYKYETSTQLFICEIKALGVTDTGLGRTKKEAKHKACANVMGE